MTLPSGHVSVTAESLLIKRRIAENVEEQQLCCLKLNRDKSPLSSSSDSDFVDCSISESELKYERALRKCRLKIVKQLDVKDVMDYLRQEDIFSENEQEEIYAVTTRRDRASVFYWSPYFQRSQGIRRVLFCVARRKRLAGGRFEIPDARMWMKLKTGE